MAEELEQCKVRFVVVDRSAPIPADLGPRFGVVILGVAPEGGSMEIGVALQRTMKEGDVLPAFGDEESLDKLAAAASQASSA